MVNANQLKVLRAAANLTQTELGSLIGASQMQISNWERGRNLPRPQHMVKLERLFNVPKEKIFFDTFNNF